MTTFKIKAESLEGDHKEFIYDSSLSILTNLDGTLIVDYVHRNRIPFDSNVFSKDKPLTKSNTPKTLKIQLGLSCNFECGYCSQRFVPRADETSQKDISNFLNKIEKAFIKPEETSKIEYWGGEPFVYWKTFKPLAEELKKRYPKALMSVITNGSLLDKEKVDWLYNLGFQVAISHDGPGQSFRGPNPFDDPNVLEAIKYMYGKFRPENRMSFNAMLHKGNQSRLAVIDFFKELTGDEDVPIGEGGVIDAYDNDAAGMSFNTKKEQFDFRRRSLDELVNHNLSNFIKLNIIDSFIKTIENQRGIKEIVQKCGMDNPDNIAVDLKGNVITCQNVSSVAVGPNGETHHCGNIEQLDDVRVTTSTHWAERDHCSSCPVIHLCSGSCMFLAGDLWVHSCNNAYSEHIVYFAYAIYKLTGYIPSFIESDSLPNERKDIWGALMEHKETNKKFIPIKSI